MAPKKPQSPAMAFLVAALKRNRKAAYRDIKAAADKKKLKLFPIIFGRAQAMLGIVKSAKRGPARLREPVLQPREVTPARRGPVPSPNRSARCWAAA